MFKGLSLPEKLRDAFIPRYVAFVIKIFIR